MYNGEKIHYCAWAKLACSADFRHEVQFSFNVLCRIFNNRLLDSVFYRVVNGITNLELPQNVITDFDENLSLLLHSLNI